MQCAPSHSGCMHVGLQVSGYACLFGGEGGCWHSVCALWSGCGLEVSLTVSSCGIWLCNLHKQQCMPVQIRTCAIDLFPLLLFMKCATMQNKVSF